jgi:hypothetical protein
MTENMGGQRPYNGFGRSENTLQFNQPIELGGKRSARIAAGRAGVDAALARTRDGRLAYAYDLAMAYAAEIAERRIGLAEDEVEEAEADLRATTALVEAGKEARLRSLQAETEVNSLRAELDTAKAQKVGAYARLAALAGVASNFTSLSEPLLARFEPRSGYGPIDPMQTAPSRPERSRRRLKSASGSHASRQSPMLRYRLASGGSKWTGPMPSLAASASRCRSSIAITATSMRQRPMRVRPKRKVALRSSTSKPKPARRWHSMRLPMPGSPLRTVR